MAPKTFHEFCLLSQETQDDIWGLAMTAPIVHFLEMTSLYSYSREDSEGQAIVRFTLPQTSSDNYLGSRHHPSDVCAGLISQAAYAATNRAREGLVLVDIYQDLAGHYSKVSIPIRVDEDIVHLSGMYSNIWSIIYRYYHEHYNQPPLDHDRDEEEQVTKNIRRMLLTWKPGYEQSRDCVGCHKLSYHHMYLKELKLMRAQYQRDRLRRGFQPKPKCNMCSKIQQQMQLSRGSENEAQIRERLLKERMLAMQPEVQAQCAAANYNLDATLAMTSALAPTGPDDDDDDAVSICSVDIDFADEFAHYNNSRILLIIDSIPYPRNRNSGGGGQIPEHFVNFHLPRNRKFNPHPQPPLHLTHQF